LQDVRQEDETARWKDAGYALTPFVALLVLLWFRKGWTIRWAGAVAAGMLLGGCGNPGSPVDALLLSADQRGQRLFDAGRFAEAADVFEDPAWRGAALYRAGEYAAAIDSLVIEGTVDAEFNIGNAYAQLERYEDAVASYESVIGQRPDRTEARNNLALVSALIKAPLDDPESSEPGGDPNQAADEFEFDEKGKQGKAGEIDEERMSNDQLTEMWMRRLQTTPADFLKFRFAAEVSIRQQEDSR
jgi:Ca-activated chloride channel family protein